MTLTMTMIGMAIGQIFGGPVSDKMGRRAPLFLGMAGFTLASLVCSLADDIYVFLIFRFVQGLSGAFGIVVSRAVARDTASGPELMRFLSVLMMVNGIAPVAAPVLGGQILLFSSWQGIFQILVLVGIIQIICTFNFKETLPPEKRSPDFRSGFFAFSMLLKDKYFFGHCLVQCFRLFLFLHRRIIFSVPKHLRGIGPGIQLYFRCCRIGAYGDGGASCAAGRDDP